MQVLTPLLFGPEVLKFSSNPRRIVIVKFNLLDRHNRVQVNFYEVRDQ